MATVTGLFPMRSLPHVIFSDTREKLLGQIEDVHIAILEFFREVPDDLLLAPAEPEGWTALKNMKHIASTNRVMSFWIRMPAGILRIYGRPTEPQPRVEDLVPTNRPFVKDHGCYRMHCICEHSRVERIRNQIIRSTEILKRAVGRRSEEELDRLKGPFRGMSLRTFVHFVLKHNLYHTGVVRERLIR